MLDTSRITLEVDQATGSSYLLEADQATESIYLWAYKTRVPCTSVCQSRPVIWRQINSLILLSTSAKFFKLVLEVRLRNGIWTRDFRNRRLMVHLLIHQFQISAQYCHVGSIKPFMMIGRSESTSKLKVRSLTSQLVWTLHLHRSISCLELKLQSGTEA